MLSRTQDGQGRIKEIVADVMRAQPNAHTVELAAKDLAPNWGGSLADMFDTCATCAPMGRAITYFSPDYCMIQVVYQARIGGKAQDYANILLDRSTDLRLDFARRQRAVDSHDQSDKAKAMIAAYLDDPDRTDTRMASHFDTVFGYRDHPPPHLPDVKACATAKARQELPFNPYDPALLQAASDALPPAPPGRPSPESEPGREYLKLALVVAPHSSDLWQAFGSSYDYEADPDAGHTKGDPFSHNAIIHSNYKTEYLRNYVEKLMRRYSNWMSMRGHDATGQPSEAMFDDKLTETSCAVVRA